MNTNNRKAFLDMIAFSEIGAKLLSNSDNGYNVLVGGGLFHGYEDHPRKLVTMTINGNTVKSTAAGRYQILAKYYDYYKKMLNLPDFGKNSQDAIAMQLIRECGAVGDVDNGDIRTAISKCRSRWASLPGAGYNQHENNVDYLMLAYKGAGGTFA